MIEISEEIRYVMLFYYKKGKNLAKTCQNFVKYTVKMLSVNEGLKSGLLNSVSEIWMSICTSLWSTSHWKSRINFAIGGANTPSKLPGNSGSTKHQPYDSLKSFEKSRLPKEALCLGATWINAKKFDWPNYHLWNVIKTFFESFMWHFLCFI